MVFVGALTVHKIIVVQSHFCISVSYYIGYYKRII